ncbi:MAG: MbnP family copper-binding protein [Woeseia sp.]
MMISKSPFKILLLFCTALASCGPGKQLVEIPFSAKFGDSALSCVSALPALRLTDLRFYVSDVFLLRDNGTDVPLEMIRDSAWQNADVALIDLEDGSATCRNGTAAMNSVLKGRAPAGDYQGLRFTLGVPETLNHGDPLIAEAPLTDVAMHWHWRSGYKFLRAGLEKDGTSYRLHLGSALCHGVIGNLQGCDAGNRAHVLLEEFNFRDDTVVLDLTSLIAEFQAPVAPTQHCEMGPDEAACDAFRSALGLDAAGIAAQPAKLFRAVARQ